MVGNVVTAVSSAAGEVLHGIGWTPSLRSDSDIRAVFYHGVGDGTASWIRHLNDEIPVGCFVRQIEFLQNRYRIVSLEEATAGVTARNGKPMCCITFDDGLASVYERAFPILAERSIPATVFVNTAVVGNVGLLWQHLLSHVLHLRGFENVVKALYRGGFVAAGSAATSTALVATCQAQFSSLVSTGALDETIRELDIDPFDVAQHHRPYLGWEQLAEMTRYGISACSHTANHLPLAAVDEERMRREIDDARSALAGRPGASSRFLSFPFGMRKDFGLRARDYALARGYEYVLEVEDGWNPEWRVRSDRCLRRVCLGPSENTDAKTYAAVELRPLIKGVLKSIGPRSVSGADATRSPQ